MTVMTTNGSKTNSQDIIRKTRDDYNLIASHFSATRERPWPEMQQFKNFIRDGHTILDWGCGNGRLLMLCEGRQVIYHGVDQSREMIEIARSKYAGQVASGRAFFSCTQQEDYSFSGNSFDLVFMIASFHHLPDREQRLKVLMNAFRAMKPGGQLIITVWNLFSDWAVRTMQKGWKRMNEHDFLIPWKDTDGTVMCERYYHRFRPGELQELLEEAGLSSVSVFFSAPGEGPGCGDTVANEKSGRNILVTAVKQQP